MGLLWWVMTALGGLAGVLVFVSSGLSLPRLRARVIERLRGAA
jgi:hypothetical protein